MTGLAVSAIVVTYRTGPILRDCLMALRGEPDLAEIIVVDNGNPAADRDWLDRTKEEDPRVTLVRPGRNLGFSAACNRAAALAHGDMLAFVNPDLIVPLGTFAKLLPLFSEPSDIWICGGRLMNPNGSEQRGSRRETLTPWRAFVELMRLDRLAPSHPYFRRFHLMDEPPLAEIVEVPAISGAFMMMPRDRFSALGGFDEMMFLHAEDLDLCLRTLLAGGRILYHHGIELHHQRSTSDVPAFFVEWHKTRSVCHYFRKHFQHTYPAWCLSAISTLLWFRFVLAILPRLPADLRRLGRGAE